MGILDLDQPDAPPATLLIPRMAHLSPSSAEEVAQILRAAAADRKTIAIFGNNSKHLMGGPVLPSEVQLSTRNLRRIIQYEKNDLTISVEAGISFSGLQTLLADNGQMIALDPPFSGQATIGGILASNSSGPMRRGFGTARDLVIGMTFATLEGKLVKTGGNVVKNVAGLDMGKLMIGSFGTLAVVTSVNFRVHSLPASTRTFVFSFLDLDAAIERRNRIVASVLQPTSVDLVSPPAATRLGHRGYVLAIRAGGSPAVLERYAAELRGCEQITGKDENTFWQQVSEFTPDFLRRQPQGVVLRVSTTLSEVGRLMKQVTGPCIARAGSGVVYVYFTSWQGVPPFSSIASERGWRTVMEFAPDEIRAAKELWPLPGGSDMNTFAMMENMKQMFDPDKLLNRSRLYGRI